MNFNYKFFKIAEIALLSCIRMSTNYFSIARKFQLLQNDFQLGPFKIEVNNVKYVLI